MLKTRRLRNLNLNLNKKNTGFWGDNIRGTLSLFQSTRLNFHIFVFILTVFRLQK